MPSICTQRISSLPNSMENRRTGDWQQENDFPLCTCSKPVADKHKSNGTYWTVIILTQKLN